ncbi:M48 family peptidase [Aureimonas flava]|uniref:M48 family peptidase n=1 Tax=Aureimonas flava TaxID=2320271 RepID=A0A3A1WK93_9HYPH|nr:SprT family zinc-dependent metalloprotease [Aureimonas flava]RIY00732.1 M48 family peptidase [Aureimonas flava]
MATRFLERLAGRAAGPRLPETLLLADRAVPLEVREHPTARRIVMRLAPGGDALRLTVPRRTPARTVLAFLERHRGWAEERLRAAGGRVAVAPGIRLPLRGEAFRLVHDPALRGARLEREGDVGVLRVGGEAPHLARRVRDLLKREARRDLQAAVDRHAATVGLLPRSLALKDTVSRWGSCTADRRLAFSWRIVMAPPAVLDYLAAHEVAHFREMNHAPAFWALCRSLCPETEAGRRWLKREGPGLHAYDFGP